MKLFCTLLTILILNQYRVLSRRIHNRAHKPNWNDVDTEYRETVPIRVNKAGQSVYPQSKHFLSYNNRVPDSEPLYYNVTAFERTFKFKLVRDRSFVSQGLVVDHVYNENVTIPFHGDLGHCFYNGHLEEDSLSSVVFNLCNGLRGSFITKGREYFIDHLEQGRNNSSAEGKIHIVYRRLENARNTNMFYELGETYFPSRSGNINELNSDLDGKHFSPKKRRKRNIDAAYVETMIAADRTMVEAFPSTAELQSFLTTIMGMVARIYKDKSIGNLINVVLVKIFVIETDLRDLKITTSASNSLTSFCKWQAKQNKPNDSDPGHYDTAILITKRDICRAAGKCDTLGLAELSTACSTKRSCAIVEDSGLNTAFTVAHELAHIFGVAHDGDKNVCTKRKGSSNIMAPSLSFDTKPWMWSPCSRKALTEFLELGLGRCLADRPGQQRSYEERLPGEKYTADQQCRLIFGSESRLCRFMVPCRRLWCVKQIDKQQGCQTHHMPWADGTSCGTDKWCIRGVCVKQRRLQIIEGQWGNWGRYGSCTRSCGGGIQFSFRQCDNPAPENGGQYCRGPRKRFASCNTQDCPIGSTDFRSLQCSKLNNKKVRIGGHLRRVTWLAKYTGVRKADECSLYCRVSGRAIYYRVSKKVIDGTPCNRYSSDICVDGQCRAAGCDRIVGSQARFDVCGVCKGDNSTCRKHTGRYNKKTKYGYNVIYDIPAGSTNVKIAQYANRPEDDNYLALRSLRQKKKYLLNGGYIVGLGIREFIYKGARVWYSGSERQTEEIKITGKTTETIRLEVLSVGKLEPPNINYTLNIPHYQKYKWIAYGPWTACSRVCKGRRRRQMLCIRRADNHVVRNKRCKTLTRPAAIKEPCNSNCRLRWNIQADHRCSVRCGSGTRRQKVRCTRVSGNRVDIIDDNYCKDLRRPPDSVSCQGPCKNSKWVYTKWTKCSKSCGAGFKRRAANCIDVSGKYLPETYCRKTHKKPLRVICNDQNCPTWITRSWSACSVTCGKGVEHRQVSCKSDVKRFPDSACRSDIKPPGRRSCLRVDCPSWMTTSWSECSVTCGKGVEQRQVICKSDVKKFPDSACRSGIKPPGRRSCSRGDCPYWITKEWSECSVTCGSGRKTRQVSCHYPLHNSVVRVNPCNQHHKPRHIKQCFERKCPVIVVPTKPRYNGLWSHGKWTRCSVTCDKGIRSRKVVCRDSKGTAISNKQCNKETKPKDKVLCVLKSCTSWKHGDWGPCSKPCGQGIQLRVVKCAFDNWEEADDKRCDASKRPPDYRTCKIRSCHPRPILNISHSYSPSSIFYNEPTTPFSPRWETGEWGQCSITCGKGVRRRPVTCKLRNEELSSLCSPLTKPQTTLVCNLGPCPKWIAGPWTQCSLSCGSGKRQRTVRCNGENTKCDNKTKPAEIEICNVRKCPQWTTGSWSKCSVSCGKGFQRRSVDCSTKNGGCNRSNRPSQIQACEYVRCPKWRLGIWSECTVSCGKGIQRRNVTCDSKSLKCDMQNKPLQLRVCNTRRCPVWNSGVWSKCSTTCGGGIRLRPVTCYPIRGLCNSQSKPIDSEECNLEECPRWITGSWSKCSASCGGGISKRRVRCNNKRIPTLCEARIKPPISKSCNLHQCPTWTPGRWSRCSKSCGEGFQTRKVECDSVVGKCDENKRPLFTQVCNIGPCPKWKTGKWSECSVSCGEGIRSRDVLCSTGDDKCSNQRRPTTSEKCVLAKCPLWTVGLWSKCSTTCDEGLQKRDVKCRPKSARCDRRIKPDDTRICNRGICPRWNPGTWSECSVSCGEGVRRRTIRCNSKTFYCKNETRPVDIKRCNLGVCPVWTVGHWSICSVTCGDGMQTRDVQCSTRDDNCVAKKPSLKRSCNLGKCPMWIVGPWEYCSVTCGLGVQKRIVYCSTQGGRCAEELKPVSSRNCEMFECPSWTSGQWSECSVTCGSGIRTRNVECISKQNQATSCNNETKPSAIDRCLKGDCPKWIVSNWTKCSVSCGEGIQTRLVACNDLKKRCNPDLRPSGTKKCHQKECPEWRVGPWEECSTSCGDGVKRREVNCHSGGDLASCDEDARPTATLKCNEMECPVWTVGVWSECSETCGDGIKRREVICRSGGNFASCDEDTRPTATLKCNIIECPVWTTGMWSECSTTCGDGVKRRDVICRSGRNLASCDEDSRPTATLKCNEMECPVWTVGVWSECSESCGDGVKRREVICRSDGNLASCDEDTRPTATLKCNIMECPVWTTGMWSECSTTCGDGVKRRDVICRSGGNLARCDEDSRPTAILKCNIMECPVWTVGVWSECSTTCGEGVKRRDVICRSGGKRASCDKDSRPTATLKCNIMECPVWTVGVWSECSASCGEAIQRREVVCRSGSGKLDCEERSKPVEIRDCKLETCPSWITGAWSKCSVSCGQGKSTRKVRCNTKTSECREEDKPTHVKICNAVSCPQWIVGPWSQCSVTCGQGRMERSVSCTLPKKCDVRSKPITSITCNMASCSMWKAGDWSQCSVSCGQGKKTRTVRCMIDDTPSNECEEESKPKAYSSCGSNLECPLWSIGNWTECSRSCGIGVASRQVRCLQGRQVLDYSACDANTRPMIRRACRIQECVKGSFWHREPWGKCSVQCSEGVKTRFVICVARNGTQIEDKYCNRRKLPKTIKSCNKYKRCGEWEVGPWSKCSTSCGDGLKTRAVRCYHNFEYTDEDNCDSSNKPIDQLFCQNNMCPLSSDVYRWQKTSWSKCSRTCGYGRKARHVTCTDNHGNEVIDKYCNAKSKPAEFFPCFEVRCPPKWKFGDWSECSRTCGHGGYQVRPVTCEGVPGAGGCNVRNKPPVWRPCNFGPCTGEFKWKVGHWSQCSVSCGIGVMKREVKCYDKQDNHRQDSFCTLPALKPDETRPCHMRPCTPRTCREIQLTSGLQADGEHVLEIQGRLLKIYCHDMTTDSPKEYITLKSGSNDNFAEIYPKRLLNPYSCPRNRTSFDSCPCLSENYEKSGGSYFSKIRIDISTMLIIADDMEFAVTRGLKPPLYGTAGDCYSVLNCPQGRFSINLQGTGLELSPKVKWRATGRSSSQQIYRYPEGKQVIGKCGGLCGACSPDDRVGLKLIVSKGSDLS